MRKTANWIVILMSLGFLAFTRPELNDVVELSSWLSGRSTAHFRKIDHNRIKALPPGTRGSVQKIKYFPRTRNYGLCLDLENSNSNKCIWVYYNKRNPRMVLHKDNTQTNQVEEADSAKITEKVTGVESKPETDPVPQQIDIQKDEDLEGVQSAVEGLDNLNQEAKKALNPEPKCENCGPKLSSYPSCNSKNSYQEAQALSMLNSNKYAGIYQGPQKEIVRVSCIQRAMQKAPATGNYKKCTEDATHPSAVGIRACNSKNHVELTAKSFNAVANCLGDYVTGSETTKAEASLMIFALTAHESGMQNNIMSKTGAGGVGQMVEDAIQAVNINLDNVKAHLRASSNPQCSGAVLKALESPMNPYRSQACDRLSISEGNPLKNMIYTFALQSLKRKEIDEVIEGRSFGRILSAHLSALEKERLLISLTAWAHNTGGGGMKVPLRVLLARYLQSGKKISDAGDVDQFLKDLAPVMRSHPHHRNRRRTGETSAFYKKVTQRMSEITTEAHSCLAN